MSHEFRPGDRVMLMSPGGWFDGYPHPIVGDIGTFVGGGSSNRVLYDRPATHTIIDPTHIEGQNIFNGKQSWNTSSTKYRYLGRRVNPAKV